MRAAVVVFPGSNADVELVHTLKDIVGVPTETVWHKDSKLPDKVDWREAGKTGKAKD